MVKHDGIFFWWLACGSFASGMRYDRRMRSFYRFSKRIDIGTAREHCDYIVFSRVFGRFASWAPLARRSLRCRLFDVIQQLIFVTIPVWAFRLLRWLAMCSTASKRYFDAYVAFAAYFLVWLSPTREWFLPATSWRSDTILFLLLLLGPAPSLSQQYSLQASSRSNRHIEY